MVNMANLLLLGTGARHSVVVERHGAQSSCCRDEICKQKHANITYV